MENDVFPLFLYLENIRSKKLLYIKNEFYNEESNLRTG